MTVGQQVEVPAPEDKHIMTTLNTTKSEMGVTGPIQGG